MSYLHNVQYYETDKMGITHHSNYVRWMEEARCAFLADIGFDYAGLEKQGIISPVTAIECKYKQTTTYGDTVSIDVSVKSFNGIKLVVGYNMKNNLDKVVCEGISEHCFLNKDGRIIRINREYPELYKALSDLACQEQ